VSLCGRYPFFLRSSSIFSAPLGSVSGSPAFPSLSLPRHTSAPSGSVLITSFTSLLGAIGCAEVASATVGVTVGPAGAGAVGSVGAALTSVEAAAAGELAEGASCLAASAATTTPTTANAPPATPRVAHDTFFFEGTRLGSRIVSDATSVSLDSSWAIVLSPSEPGVLAGCREGPGFDSGSSLSGVADERSTRPAAAAARARSSTASTTDFGRRSGSLSSIFRMGASSGARLGSTELGRGGGVLRCWTMMLITVSPSNGSAPVSTWNASTPNE
jgi:hypothetical protein